MPPGGARILRLRIHVALGQLRREQIRARSVTGEPAGVRAAAMARFGERHRRADHTLLAAPRRTTTSGTLNVESYASIPCVVLAVLAKALAVIAGHDDDRGRRQPARPQRVDDPSDLRVRVRDFAVVGIAAGLRADTPPGGSYGACGS